MWSQHKILKYQDILLIIGLLTSRNQKLWNIAKGHRVNFDRASPQLTLYSWLIPSDTLLSVITFCTWVLHVGFSIQKMAPWLCINVFTHAKSSVFFYNNFTLEWAMNMITCTRMIINDILFNDIRIDLYGFNYCKLFLNIRSIGAY